MSASLGEDVLFRISRRTHADNVPSTFSCRLQWKARRAEIEILAKQATELSNEAKRIPVLADTTLLRGFQAKNSLPEAVSTRQGNSVAKPVQSLPSWRFLIGFTQMWMKKSSQAFPPFARNVLEYLGNNIHHAHQMTLAQFSAYHLRDIIYNLDMLAIARSTKLTTTSKENVEDETIDSVEKPGSLVETEFHGGEQTEEPENDK